MKKLLLFIFFILFFILLIFLSQPQLRHAVFTGFVQFPEFATMQAMKGGLITRDFDRVLPWLDRQHKLTNLYGKTKNKMTPGLLENIKQAYKIAVLREEREQFIPLLEKTYSLNPKNIDLNIMLASAYQFLDQKKSLDYLSQARLILPSDQRIFQLANLILRNSDDLEEKLSWCNAYRDSQFGDYSAYKSSTLLGIGYRRLALEFSHNGKRDLFLNEGLELGKQIKYEFILDGLHQLQYPSLRVSNGGGLEILFHNIELFAEGELIKSYKNESIELFPETGYFIDGRVISSNIYGENIFFDLLEVEENMADKVIIELTIKKLPLNNSIFCSS